MIIPNVESFLSYLESVRGRTRRVVEAIPPEHIEWTHRQGAFTLGGLVRHVAATERYMFAETARGNTSTYPGHGRELADGYDAVVAYFDRMHAESVEIYRSLTPEALEGKCVTPAGTSITTWKWLRAMIEHEIHHRGQLYLMLSMLGVKTPPIYGLTEEQLRERSVPA
jgi:uncharacterized damage-inducible protein DinB